MTFTKEQKIQTYTLDFAKSALDKSSLDKFKNWIPSTPAVLLMDGNGTINYFGPYHQEGVCDSTNSYLEIIFQKLGQDQAVSVVNTLAYGCFCGTGLNQQFGR